jgi:hypothetical protein
MKLFPSGTIRPSVIVRCSAIEYGSLSQPAACSFGTTCLLHVSASIGILRAQTLTETLTKEKRGLKTRGGTGDDMQQFSFFLPTTQPGACRPRKSLCSTRLVSIRGRHAAIQLFLSHNSARWVQAVTADSISCTATHSSGPCALCSPQNRLGVGRPSSVRREPSVPPRTT